MHPLVNLLRGHSNLSVFTNITGNLCGTSKQPQASAQAALAQWKKAGFPASKQLLGLPLYGYVSKSTKSVLTGSLMPSSDMMLLVKTEAATVDGAEPDTHFLNGAHVRTRLAPVAEEAAEPQIIANESDKEVTIQATLTSWWGQQIPFKEIVKAGALVKRSDGNYGEGGGFTMGVYELESAAISRSHHVVAFAQDGMTVVTLQYASTI